MGLFGFGKSAVEKRLIETYAVGLQPRAGRDARKVAKQMVEMARRQAEAEGTLDPENAYEAYMRSCEADPVAARRLKVKREDGVTDEDLAWWWGLHDLDRRMMLLDDDASRVAFCLAKRNDGLEEEEAIAELRTVMPIYGDPTDTEHTTDDDRPLPVELKDRVNSWVEREASMRGRWKFRVFVDRFSSMNALIRSRIRKGYL